MRPTNPAALAVLAGAVIAQTTKLSVSSAGVPDDPRMREIESTLAHEHDPWILTEEAKLLASDGAENDRLGVSVSISGDRALVGAYYYPGDDDNGIEPGAAYVFVRNGAGWTEEAKLMASDGADDDYFGFSVALDGDRALVGAYGDDDNGIDSGSAYVFVRNGAGWTEEAKLVASDGADHDTFGSVSLDGDQALVGAGGDDENGIYSGSAYVFVRSGTSWMEETKLTASDGGEEEYFGASVSLDGVRALVSKTGSAYVFVRSGTSWTEEAKLSVSSGEYYSGIPASLDGDRALVGA